MRRIFAVVVILDLLLLLVWLLVRTELRHL
jgi:hypothetical protein